MFIVYSGFVDDEIDTITKYASMFDTQKVHISGDRGRLLLTWAGRDNPFDKRKA